MNEEMTSDKDRVIREILKSNNLCVGKLGLKVLARDALLLLPHCIQYSECPYRIAIHMENCTRCGGCVMGKILELRDKIGFQMIIAPGGGFARRAIEKLCPKFIIASACEHDLASGIMDIKGIPIWGILISRPNGPCIDTCLDFAEIDSAVKRFLI
ncbi:MAG: DUF116 domain-containing protein [Candidatus Methanomethylophilaceae archaeon]|nr:DUF116 domain-containing protein [Candidatus Methanomethylophilaceae archaeon]MDY0224620.1 DUF116 domain-containing protein [Candidatus Methanomethylophilaceae archaeon]